MKNPTLGFIPEPLLLSLSVILPSRKTPEGLLTSRKFKQITKSIEAIGLIEPLSVTKPDRSGQHILLDGHSRLVALKQLGFEKAPCLVATDDESYTYVAPEFMCCQPGRWSGLLGPFTVSIT